MTVKVFEKSKILKSRRFHVQRYHFKNMCYHITERILRWFSSDTMIIQNVQVDVHISQKMKKFLKIEHDRNFQIFRFE